MSKSPQVITLMGPTASGKTALALAIAQKIDIEIISVDSALIYRDMNIGTAKPSAQELAQVPHHLIDILDPAQSYSAADFCREARALIDKLLAVGKTPLLVGGSMLYFKALLEGLSPVPPSDPKIRVDIEMQAKQAGWPVLHQELAQIDPVTAQKLHPNHSQRIGRALEVFRATGIPLSEWQKTAGQSLQADFDWIQIALQVSHRSVLHQRIEQRFDQMLQNGFVEEVQALYQRGDLDINLPSMRAVGYRQVWQYLAAQCSYAQMREQGIAATRQLAKRQMTWLRNWPNLCMIETLDTEGCPLSTGKILLNFLRFL